MSDQAAELASVPDDDLAWCHDVVEDVSRTFALTIDVLDEPMSSYICVGYLLCRIGDTIEDTDALSDREKTALLERYNRALDPDREFGVEEFDAALDPHLPEDRTDDWTVVADSSRVVRTFERLPSDVRAAIRPPTRELVEGMRMFVERHGEHGGIRIESEAELEEYCYYVAGTVGHLITNLVGRTADEDRVEPLRETAEGFGQLLQLVNIAKDVHGDYTRENNVYLPADWLEAAGVSQEELLSPADRRAAASVVERTVDHARSSLADARSYLETLALIDRNAFVAWAIPFLLAVGTLRELSARPEETLSPGGVKISRSEVAAVVAAVTADGGPPLSALQRSVRRGELG